MKNVLILCTGNSCRSQIAEAYLRHFGLNRGRYYSAGIKKQGVSPRAIAIMQEDGINISKQSCQLISEYERKSFDYVISLCNKARKECPDALLDNAFHIHSAFKNPERIKGNEQEVYNAYRETRDGIKAFCKSFVTNYL